MKTTRLFGFLILSLFFITSCNEDSSDDVKNATPAYLQQIELNVPEGKSTKAVFSYNADTQLQSVNLSDINGHSIPALFNYATDGDLSSVDFDGDNFKISDLLGENFQAFEYGRVIEYDSNSNPSVIEIINEEEDEEWNEETQQYEVIFEKIRYTIEYDSKPFFLYYTLKSAGMIDLMDSIHLLMNAESSEITVLRKLLPSNNIIGISAKNEAGQDIGNISIDYVYNDINYPISAKIVVSEGEHTENLSVNFKYLEK